MNKASNDSEDSTDMGPSGMDESAVARDHQMAGGSKRQEFQGNQQHQHLVVASGHHDPKQRRIYVNLFTLACVAALVGWSLIITWVFNYRQVTGIGLTNAGQLSNLHFVLMFTFMISLNMYAVLVYRTHYSAPKEQLKWTHAIISGINIVMSLLGVFSMFKAHLINNQANFYSLHSWIGVTVNGFYLAQFVLGFVSFMKPGLSKHRRASLMPWHRFIGAGILVLAGAAAVTGILELVIFQDSDKSYSKFAPITFIANFAGISVVILTAITIYLLSAPQYLRPAKPEEQPLRR